MKMEKKMFLLLFTTIMSCSVSGIKTLKTNDSSLISSKLVVKRDDFLRIKQTIELYITYVRLWEEAVTRAQSKFIEKNILELKKILDEFASKSKENKVLVAVIFNQLVNNYQKKVVSKTQIVQLTKQKSASDTVQSVSGFWG